MKSQAYAKKANRRLFFKRVKVFWQKQGFYIVLFLCVCAMGTALFFSSGDGMDFSQNNKAVELDKGEMESSDEITVIDQTNLSEFIAEREKDIPGGIYYLTDDELEKDAVGDTDKSDQKGQVAQENNENSNQLTAQVISDVGEISFPVINGEIFKPYAMEQLLYSETLREFRTHQGVDILGELGSDILAFLPGTVESVDIDELWGVIVVIDHGKGLKSVYANLAESIDVEVGRYVLSGDKIGAIGQSSNLERSDPPHLHFEIHMNNKPIDPARYIDE
jgi:murein DD-endopeptidase MepM/ murein hydrolase activator NlpD